MDGRRIEQGCNWSSANSKWMPSRLGKSSYESGLPAAAARPIIFVPAGTTIYREGDPCRAIFQVAHGLARTVKQTSEGRRLVQSFCVPGDIFGMSCTRSYMSTSEAVSDLHLTKIDPVQLESWLEDDRAFASQLWVWLFRNSDRVEQLRQLARAKSVQKLSYFILDMADRMSAKTRVELQMSRYDIGDYLGISSETVSRAFTLLRLRGTIHIDGHTIHIVKMPELQQLATSCLTLQEQG
jgi:CRP-like cAMP-binding protein